MQGAKLDAVQSAVYVGHATCIFAPAFSYPETICLLEYKVTGMQWGVGSSISINKLTLQELLTSLSHMSYGAETSKQFENY